MVKNVLGLHIQKLMEMEMESPSPETDGSVNRIIWGSFFGVFGGLTILSAILYATKKIREDKNRV